MKFLIDFN